MKPLALKRLALACLVVTMGAIPLLGAGSASAQPTCQTSPIFDDQLNAPWYPASWSGTVTTEVEGAAEVTMPNNWSALSFAAPPVSVAGCTHVSFEIRSAESSALAAAELRVALNNNTNTPTGDARVMISPTERTVLVPLTGYDLPDDEVTRFVLQNTGNPGFAVVIDNIGFVDVDNATDPTTPTVTPTPTVTVIPTITPTPTPTATPEPDDPQGGPCHTVFGDTLNAPWTPASWTIQNLNMQGEVSADFPQRWGAVSFRSPAAFDASNYTMVSFTMRASRANSEFALRLNTIGNQPPITRVFSVGTEMQQVRMLLSDFSLTDGQIARMSIINRATARGTSIVVDDIRLDNGPSCQIQQPVTSTIGSGVNLPSGEYVCVHDLEGEGYRPTELFDHRLNGVSHVELAGYLSDWGVQTVRIPLNSHCWLGGFDYIYPDLQGEAYRSEIVELVDALQAAGITSFLELAWTADAGQEAKYTSPVLPDADLAPQFWTQVADRFRSYGDDVFYGPYNEPHTDRLFGSSTQAWQCWRDGCTGPDGLLQSLGRIRTRLSGREPGSRLPHLRLQVVRRLELLRKRPDRNPERGLSGHHRRTGPRDRRRLYGLPGRLHQPNHGLG